MYYERDNARFLRVPIGFSQHEHRILTGQKPYFNKDFIDVCLNQYQFNILAITPEHTDALITLPFYHKDPFDRLLVAQAIVENIPIISVDTILDRYGIQRLW